MDSPKHGSICHHHLGLLHCSRGLKMAPGCTPQHAQPPFPGRWKAGSRKMKVPISGEECHEPFRAALRLRWLPLPSQHRHSGAGILEGDILGPGQKRPPSLRKLRERAAQPLGRYAASPQPPWLPALWAEQAPSPLLPAPGHSLPPEALTPEKWPLRVVRSPGPN